MSERIPLTWNNIKIGLQIYCDSESFEGSYDSNHKDVFGESGRISKVDIIGRRFWIIWDDEYFNHTGRCTGYWENVNNFAIGSKEQFQEQLSRRNHAMKFL